MGERRKRKSQWDMEEETKQFSRMSEHDSWAGMDHHSRHDSGRLRHEFSSSRSFTSPNFRDQSGQPSRESNEGNEIGGGNRYYQNMSPGLDGMERHKYKHSLENDRSESHRHMRRERSRSRSQSRGRERVRGFSRSRSRSRSRSNGSPVGRTRSRSPIGDYRNQSHVWGDQRGVPFNKSDRICRDFPSGRCRRGSQCRFVHTKNSSRGNISKDPYSRVQGSDLRDDVSASGHGEDEQFQSKSRNAVPCREFVKGRCKWGDTCRFSHHLASSYETFDEGNRYRKPLCKYFAAGKCDQDNCRFSHEDPKFNRPGEVADAIRISDNDAKPARWSESVEKFTNYTTGDSTDAKIDNRLGGRMENENISWRIPEVGGDMGAAEPIDNENRANRQEHPIFHDLQLQNKDVHGQSTLQDDQGFSMQAWEQNISPISPHIQLQDRGVAENNTTASFQSGVLDEAQVPRNHPTHAIPLAVQNLNRNGGNVLPLHSSGLNETDGVQNMVWPNPSNGFSGSLNWSETQLGACSDLHPQMQNHQKAVQMTGVLETKATPVINPNLFPTPRFDNVQQFTENVDRAVISNSITLAHKPTNAQTNPVVVSSGPFNPVENERVTSEHHVDYAEQDNQMQAKQSSPNPTVDMELDDLKVDNSENLNLKQETPPANQEVDENNRVIGEESKKVENNNKHLENLNGDKKVEESVANKDDKGMRLFKNSLIEFVKDILKPTWKEGRLSRDVHKTIVKKVVDKVTGTIQADHVPKTQEKVDQYLSFSKPKIAKLVQAYVERSLKTNS